MRFDSPLDLLLKTEPSTTLVELARIEAGDSAVVSCYLDTRAGNSGCLTFLNRKAAAIRDALRGVDRFNFDIAVEMIRRSLDRELHRETQGIAIFARGAADNRHLSLIETATPLENRLVHSRAPEILPLVALHQRELPCDLLILNRDRFELLETGLGIESHALLSGEIAAIAEQDGALVAATGSARWQAPVSDETAWLMRKALVGSESPLLLVGDADSLCEAADWLPDQATERLVGCVEMPGDADFETARRTARMRLRQLYRDGSQRLGAMVEVYAQRRQAVVGYRAVLDALRHDRAEVLILAGWDQPGLGLPWDAELEVCCEALRRRKRVILVDSPQLRESGSVACLLRESCPRADVSETATRTRYDRVA